MGKHFQHLFFATNPLKHVSYHFRFWDPNLTPLFAQVYTLYMGVSKNRGTQKWMVYNGKPY